MSILQSIGYRITPLFSRRLIIVLAFLSSLNMALANNHLSPLEFSVTKKTKAMPKEAKQERQNPLCVKASPKKVNKTWHKN